MKITTAASSLKNRSTFQGGRNKIITDKKINKRMEKIEVKKPKNQVREIAAFIANNGGKIDEITRLKLANLETWLTIEQSAREKIRKEGLTLAYNKGTSVGVSPIYKIFTDAHKFILKYKIIFSTI